MSINFPTNDNPIRELIDVSSVVTMLSPDNRFQLPTLSQALESAKAFFQSEPAAHDLYVICWRANGIVLERIGRKGGHKTTWKF